MGLNKRLISTAAAGVVNTENFTPKLYSGGSAGQVITGVGFQPDLIIAKRRFATEKWFVVDAARTGSLFITTEAEISYRYLTPNSDGFVVNGTGGVHNTGSLVAYCFKGGGAAVSNTNGSITSQVSANQDAGFSIVTWTGDGNDATVGHGLSSQPELVIAKGRANLALYNQWTTYHKDLQDDYTVFLNLTNAEANGFGNYWRKSAFSNTVFGIGDDIYGPNVNGTTMVAYCFHSVDGYQKVGSYSGNSSTDGPIINCGFRPRFVMIKGTNAITNWSIYDNERSPSNPRNNILWANLSDAELVAYTQTDIDFNSDSFQLRGTNGGINQTGRDYIYLAIA